MTDTIGVAMLGYAFMGKAHSRAFREASYLEPALQPRLVSISGRTAEKVEEARRLHGWEEATTDWREQVADERVQLFDNGGPNDLHAEPTIDAARNGKHVLCEKPLGRSAKEAYTIWRAAEEAGVVHMCGFNYRFVPAVRLAREIVESGDLIDGYEFHYPQELSEENLDEVREALGDRDIYCIATGLHLDPRFGRGGLTSPDEETRTEARRRTVAAADFAGLEADGVVGPLRVAGDRGRFRVGGAGLDRLVLQVPLPAGELPAAGVLREVCGEQRPAVGGGDDDVLVLDLGAEGADADAAVRGGLGRGNGRRDAQRGG